MTRATLSRLSAEILTAPNISSRYANNTKAAADPKRRYSA